MNPLMWLATWPLRRLMTPPAQDVIDGMVKFMEESIEEAAEWMGIEIS